MREILSEQVEGRKVPRSIVFCLGLVRINRYKLSTATISSSYYFAFFDPTTVETVDTYVRHLAVQKEKRRATRLSRRAQLVRIVGGSDRDASLALFLPGGRARWTRQLSSDRGAQNGGGSQPQLFIASLPVKTKQYPAPPSFPSLALTKNVRIEYSLKNKVLLMYVYINCIT